MRKVMVVAVREYLAAVRTKAFLISLLLMPVLMGASIVMQILLKDSHDTKERRFAVIDLSPDGKLYEAIRAAAEKPPAPSGKEKDNLLGPDTKAAVAPMVIERAVPKDSSQEAVADLRVELSDQVKAGRLLGFAVIGAGVLEGKDGLEFQTNRVMIQDFLGLVQGTVTAKVHEHRCQAAHLDYDKVKAAIAPVNSASMGLSKRTGGKVEVEDDTKRIASFFVPLGAMMLLFMVIMMTATPMMQGVVEEKMNRIAEVLLGSVRPFDLMLGKLLGMTGVSLTITSVYLGGAYWAAHHYKFADYLPASLVGWVLVYQALGVLLYGSLFIAIGAACTDMKETQTLMMPVMFLVIIPMSMVGVVMQEPNGPVVTAVSFFPFSTPMLMVARQAAPPGLSWEQPAIGVVVVLLTTLLCVWAAGRIFRVGLLLQGKGAKMSDLFRWVFHG